MSLLSCLAPHGLHTHASAPVVLWADADTLSADRYDAARDRWVLVVCPRRADGAALCSSDLADVPTSLLRRALEELSRPDRALTTYDELGVAGVSMRAPR